MNGDYEYVATTPDDLIELQIQYSPKDQKCVLVVTLDGYEIERWYVGTYYAR